MAGLNLQLQGSSTRAVPSICGDFVVTFRLLHGGITASRHRGRRGRGALTQELCGGRVRLSSSVFSFESRLKNKLLWFPAWFWPTQQGHVPPPPSGQPGSALPDRDRQEPQSGPQPVLGHPGTAQQGVDGLRVSLWSWTWSRAPQPSLGPRAVSAGAHASSQGFQTQRTGLRHRCAATHSTRRLGLRP